MTTDDIIESGPEPAGPADAPPQQDAVPNPLASAPPDNPFVEEGVAGDAFRLPEDLAADDEAMREFKELARKGSIARENAQALLDLHVRLQRKQAAGMAAEFERINAGWLGEVRANPEFGGQRLGRTVECANLALKRFGSPALRQSLHEWRVANNPELVYMLARIGRAASEGRSLAGDGGVPGKSAAEALYPTMTNQAFSTLG